MIISNKQNQIIATFPGRRFSSNDIVTKFVVSPQKERQIGLKKLPKFQSDVYALCSQTQRGMFTFTRIWRHLGNQRPVVVSSVISPLLSRTCNTVTKIPLAPCACSPKPIMHNV